MVRGELFRLRAPRGSRGHEQQGRRYAVVVQADELPLSTVLVSPTSVSARPATFRPTVEIGGEKTRVLVEQTTAVDLQRLGKTAGRLAPSELRAVDEALALVLAL